MLLLAWVLGFTGFHMCLLYIMCVCLNRHIYMYTHGHARLYVYIHTHITCAHICTHMPLPVTWEQNQETSHLDSLHSEKSPQWVAQACI